MPKHVGRLHVVGIVREPSHGVSHLTAHDLGSALQVQACRLVHHDGEAIRLDVLQRGGQIVDRVVGPGRRAVPSGIPDRQLERGVRLLGSLDHVNDGLAVFAEPATTTVRVERELGVRQLTVRRHHAPRRHHSRFLISGKRDDEVARRDEAFSFQPQERGGQHRNAELVVEAASPEEVSVLFEEREGIALPVLRKGIDHVHVGQEQNRTLSGRSVATVAHDEPGRFLSARNLKREDVHVLFRESTRLKPICQIGGNFGHPAMCCGRPVSDDAAIDIQGFQLVGLGVVCARVLGGHARRKQEQAEGDWNSVHRLEAPWSAWWTQQGRGTRCNRHAYQPPARIGCRLVPDSPIHEVPRPAVSPFAHPQPIAMLGPIWSA